MAQGWKLSEIRYLQENFAKQSKYEIAEHLGRTPSAITGRAYVLGLRSRNFVWTEKAVKFLNENRGKMLSRDIAKQLGTTLSSVRNKLHETKWKN